VHHADRLAEAGGLAGEVAADLVGAQIGSAMDQPSAEFAA
jgi:hypothetical protein